MKKRTLTAVIVLFTAFSVVGTAFAAWHFGYDDDKSANVRLAYDDIAENFGFTQASKKRNTSKNYTIYLFPSTLYLNDYIDYLDGKSAVKPEELYGYVQPVTDGNGNVVYANAKINYEAVYPEVITSGDGGYINNVINSPNGYDDLYLSASAKKDYTKDYVTNYSDVLTVSPEFSWSGTIKYLDSDENEHELARTEIGSYIGDSDVKYRGSQFNQPKYLYRNQHRYDRFGAWRTLEYGEGRYLPLKITVGADFAYSDFSDLVLSTLSSMPNGYANDSFTMTFTHWAYVDMQTDGGNYRLPYYASAENTKSIAAGSDTRGFTEAQLRVRNAYLGYMLEQYFDIMQDFEKYSDDDGVIRLFPTFSCGSNRVQSAEFTGSAEKWKEGIDRGTGDGIYMFTLSSGGNTATGNIQVKEIINDYRLHSTMTTQTAENYNNYSTGSRVTETVRCSMYANLNLDTIDKLEIWLNPKCGATENWYSDDLLLYDISGTVIQSIKKEYGDGLYNMYLFIGNMGLTTDAAMTSENMPSISNIVEAARTSDAIFPSLTGKNLISLESFGATKLTKFKLDSKEQNVYDNMSIAKLSGTQTDCSINGVSFKWPKAGRLSAVDNIWSSFLGAKGLGSGVSGNKFYRPVMLAIEKVRDSRVLLNLNIDERATAQNNENDLQNDYERGSSFRMISEDIYFTGLKSATIDTAEAINSKYPYSYFLSGVDFTGAANDYFQIRFQRRYRSDLPFSGTDGTATVDEQITSATDKGGGLAPAMNVIYNPGEGGLFGEDKRFINAFGSQGFFTAVNAHMDDTDQSAEYQVFFKLRNEEMRGIYDFILIYVPYEFWSVSKKSGDVVKTSVYYNKDEAQADTDKNSTLFTHKPGFYLYAYRHTNIFLKVVEKDPETYVPTDGSTFIKHDDYTNNRLLFESVFQLGIKLDINAETQRRGTGNSDITLGDGYTAPGGSPTFAKCVNTWTQAYIENNVADINKIVLRDHVTKGIVGYYRKVGGTNANPNNCVTVTNGGVKEYYELVLEELVVRKNYIFYMDTVIY